MPLPDSHIIWKKQQDYHSTLINWKDQCKKGMSVIKSLMVALENTQKNKNQSLSFITKTRLFKYTEKFTTKRWKFSDKNSDIFHISAQNIDCVYSLEPPRRIHNLCFWAEIWKKMYIPVNPSFTVQNWGLRGQNYIGMFPWCYWDSSYDRNVVCRASFAL